MKFIPLLSLVLSLGSTLIAQEGVTFAEPSWEEALEEARSHDKIIFLDAYAEWCGPCRKMENEVFTEQAVGDYFNEHFVNVRLDMEKGIGVELAKKFEVDAFPSLLFLDASGNILHRAVGFHNAPELIQLGRIANDPHRRYGSYTSRYASGERDPEFMYDYTLASLMAMSANREKVARAYFDTQDDWGSERNRRLVFSLANRSDSDWFQYLIHNRKSFEELYGSQAVMDRIQGVIFSEAFAEEENEDLLPNVKELLEISYPEIAGQLFGLFCISYHQYNNDNDAFAKAAIDYYNNFPIEDPAELNNVAWTFYDLVEDPAMLEEALGWSQKSIEIDPGYYNYDTLAGLYFKLGRKRKARKAAQEAINLAKSEGVDYSSTQSLLNQIEEL